MIALVKQRDARWIISMSTQEKAMMAESQKSFRFNSERALSELHTKLQESEKLG